MDATFIAERQQGLQVCLHGIKHAEFFYGLN